MSLESVEAGIRYEVKMVTEDEAKEASHYRAWPLSSLQLEPEKSRPALIGTQSVVEYPFLWLLSAMTRN
jgi:hypothetical protein